MPVQSGPSAEVHLTVTDDDTALAFRSGVVPVLATPRVVALVEEATCLAIAQQLGEGETSVGMRVQLDHLAPVKVGSTVRATARLEGQEGRRLVFSVNVTDSSGLVAAGKVTRAVVNVAGFMEKAR
jgi:fluoroacetyl-CoA thioesterase